METSKTRILIDPETFLAWLREEPNCITEVMGLDSEEFKTMVNIIDILFEEHVKWLNKLLDEAGLTNQLYNVLQFPGKKSNPFKLAVDNTNKGEE